MESYESLLKRTAYQQENLLIDDSDFTPSDGLREKVNVENALKPFYGDTTVFDLDEAVKESITSIQKKLYSLNEECFCVRLASSTLHMTLHDLSASPSLEGVRKQTADNEASLLRKREESPLPCQTIRMKTNYVCDSVKTSLVLNLLPENAEEWLKLASLYEWVDEIRPLKRDLYPHITLAYYNYYGFSGESLKKLKKTVLELNQTHFDLTLYTSKLYYQRFTDMNTYRNVFPLVKR